VARAITEGIESGGYCSAKIERAFEYASRIRERAVEDPWHNFPFSFDQAILSTTPDIVRGGRKAMLYVVSKMTQKLYIISW